MVDATDLELSSPSSDALIDGCFDTSLTTAAGSPPEVAIDFGWSSRGTTLKSAFYLNSGSSKANGKLSIGCISRNYNTGWKNEYTLSNDNILDTGFMSLSCTNALYMKLKREEAAPGLSGAGLEMNQLRLY